MDPNLPAAAKVSARAALIDLAQIALWTLLAEWLLPPGGHFHLDEAVLYDHALQVARTLHLAAYGTPASTTGVLAAGGAQVNLLAPAFFFARDPIAGARWVVLLSAIGVFAFDRALGRLAVAPFFRVAAVTLLLWSRWHAAFADRMWPPHLLLFAVPLLLWLSAALLTASRGRGPLALAWGATAATVLQLHGSGTVAVALCFLLLLPAEDGGGLSPRLFPAALLGVIVAYAPYLVAEWPKFANLRAWIAPGLRPRLDWTALRLGVESFAILPSHAAASMPGHLGSGVLGAAQPLTFWIAAASTPFGFLVRGRWRRPSAAALVLIPSSLWFSGRGYAHHYVVAAMPFLVLPVAAGLWFWARRSRELAGLATAYLVAFVGIGAALMVRDWRLHPPEATLARQEQIAAALVRAGPDIQLEGSLAADAIPYEILARRLSNVELSFGRGVPCALVDPPPPGNQTPPAGPRFVRCETR